MEQQEFISKIGQFRNRSNGLVPSKSKVFQFLEKVNTFLFPIITENQPKAPQFEIIEIEHLLLELLNSFNSAQNDTTTSTRNFMEKLPQVYCRLLADANAIYQGDPAASSIEEVIISYPGFYAILTYRIAHELYLLNIPIVPRMLTEYAHSKTGIDIHPGAHIGDSFCIDHGTGIVIGESTIIGSNVKIYQGVTLGALSVSKEKAGNKRHPDIEDNVTIYAGSTILGGDTKIGHHSIIGGNVWLTESIEPHSVVLNKSEAYIKNNSPEYKQEI